MSGDNRPAAANSGARGSPVRHGFAASTTTGTPDALFRHWLPRLSGSQLRVVLFLVRRAFGPTQQRGDGVISVSLSDFIEGTTWGGRQTSGCGIESRPTVLAAVAELERLGLIAVERATDRRSANRYRLVVDPPLDGPPARGFSRPTTTPVPDDLFDLWLARLSDVELRVLLYVTWRTLGWKKETDWIDIDQFIGGIRAGDGRIVDEGCGLKSRKHVYRGLASLEKAGVLRRSGEARVGADGAPRMVTVHGLVFAGEAPPILRDKALPATGGAPTSTPKPRADRGVAHERSVGGSQASARRDQAEAPTPSRSPAEKHSDGGSPEQADARPSGGGLIWSYVSTAGGSTWSSTGPGAGSIRSGWVVQFGHAGRFSPVPASGSIGSPQHETRKQETHKHETDHHQGPPPGTPSAQTGTGGGGGPISDVDKINTACAEIRAALSGYFADDLVDSWLRRGPGEGERIMTWLRYIDEPSGRGLDNPIGFLRSRIDGQGWPPGATRYGDASAIDEGSDAARCPCAADGPRSPAEDTWAAICAELRLTLTEDNYRHWFGPTRALRLEDDTLTVGVPDTFHVQWLDRRLRGVIDRATGRVAQGTNVAFDVHAGGG